MTTSLDDILHFMGEACAGGGESVVLVDAVFFVVEDVLGGVFGVREELRLVGFGELGLRGCGWHRCGWMRDLWVVGSEVGVRL